jgi:uncharacterized membrane protein
MKKFRDFGTMSSYIDLNVVDVIKWFVVAILSASLTAIYNLLNSWVMLENEQRKIVLLAWVTAWLGYLIKNVFTNSENQILTQEPTFTSNKI